MREGAKRPIFRNRRVALKVQPAELGVGVRRDLVETGAAQTGRVVVDPRGSELPLLNYLGSLQLELLVDESVSRCRRQRVPEGMSTL